MGVFPKGFLWFWFAGLDLPFAHFIPKVPFDLLDQRFVTFELEPRINREAILSAQAGKNSGAKERCFAEAGPAEQEASLSPQDHVFHFRDFCGSPKEEF